MKKYSTKAGDQFDLIAYQQMGSCKYTEKLIDANRDKIEYFIFPAGIELIIPDIETAQITRLPPWRT